VRHLNLQESDRLYRVANTLSQAAEVLGSFDVPLQGPGLARASVESAQPLTAD
jgi:hypothetical protein